MQVQFKETPFFHLSHFPQVFLEHRIDGAALAVLSETHLTSILGIKLGDAIKILKAVEEILPKKTTLY